MSFAADAKAETKVFLLISSLLGGGAERVAANLANYWVQEGKIIKLVTLDSAESDFYVLDRRIERVALSLAQPSAGAWASFKNNIARIRAVRREVVKFSPEVAIGFMTVSSVLLAISTLGLACKTIGTERSHPPANPLGFTRETARAVSYGTLNAVLALTDQSAEWIRRHTLARAVHVIPNAARWPLSVQEPIVSPEVACRAGRKILLAVGRLDPVKGYLDLLEVFSTLVARMPEWDLVILGEGHQRPELSQLVQHLGLAGRVFLPGIVGNVADWYQRASLYVMTSKYEGFPNTLVEAMASGLASVSFDCDVGPRNIIRANVDGVLVPNRDVLALERTLYTLMADEDLRVRYAKRALEVRERLSERRIMQRWNDLLVSLSVGQKRAIGSVWSR